MSKTNLSALLLVIVVMVYFGLHCAGTVLGLSTQYNKRKKERRAIQLPFVVVVTITVKGAE